MTEEEKEYGLRKRTHLDLLIVIYQENLIVPGYPKPTHLDVLVKPREYQLSRTALQKQTFNHLLCLPKSILHLRIEGLFGGHFTHARVRTEHYVLLLGTTAFRLWFRDSETYIRLLFDLMRVFLNIGNGVIQVSVELRDALPSYLATSFDCSRGSRLTHVNQVRYHKAETILGIIDD